ncbi:helix-turn-helix domain-containing protein [Dyadobacter helix]|uniref:helix-turn-helix domain-containing protein n=1 Tax=Dyadobacter helix TaxID=2822344 RepID=UPI001BFCB193|nr:helix-turn-helix domain-containing protein [Dyadobacter sp. CECT 9275]
MSYFHPESPRIYLQIGLSGCFFIGPSLYYFTKAALVQLQKTPVTWKYTFCFWFVLIVIVGLMVPYQSHPWDWNHYIVHIIYGQWVVYFAFTGWELRSVFAKLFLSGEKLSPSEKPILSIFATNAVILAAYLIVFFTSSNYIYISGAVFFSLLIYLNIPLFVNRRKSDTAFLGNEDAERYGNKKIIEEHALSLTARLHKIMTEQQLYKNPDLKLNELAAKINISGHQLSQLLNDNMARSFAVYVNEYRINEVCELMARDRGMKLEAIGYEVGFNSKSTFYAAFKKHKNTTPTLYRAQ